MVAGFVILFPSLSVKAVTFEVKVPRPPCVEAVNVDIFDKGERVRGFKIRLEQGQTEITHEVWLAKGEYLVSLRFTCPGKEPNPEPRLQPVIVTQTGVVPLDFSRTCPCHSARMLR